MSDSIHLEARRGGFAAAWLATLALTFWLGTRWAPPDRSGGAKPPSAAVVRAATGASASETKNNLDPTDPAQVAAGLERGAVEPGDYRKQAHLARVAARLDLSAVTTALDAEEARGPLGDRDEVVEALLARYAEIDPVAATVRAAGIYEKFNGNPAAWIETPLAFWWKRDAQAARAWVGGLPFGPARRQARTVLARFLVASDPGEALRMQVQNVKSPYDKDTSQIFMLVAERDLALAATRARAEPFQSGSQSMAVRGVLAAWIARDPAAAYRWATTTTDRKTERETDLQSFYGIWCQQDPAAAGAWALDHGLAPRPNDWGDDQSGCDEIIKSMVNRDPTMAQNFVARLPAPTQREARLELCKAWEQKDPVAAANYAVSSGDEGMEDLKFIVSDCVKNLVGSDLAGARSWVEQLPPGKVRTDAMDQVCEKWSETDPKSCASYLLTQQIYSGTSLLENSGFRGATGSWAQANPDEMLHWSQNLPDADVRDAALRSGAIFFSGDDWSRTAQMVAAISPARRGDTVNDIVNRLGGLRENRVTEATALVEALPDDQTAVTATQTFVQQWAQDDVAATAAWVATRPAGPTRGTRRRSRSSAEVMDKQGIAAAEQTVALVQDPRQKASALVDLTKSYVAKDQASAKAWIASSPLFAPDATRQVPAVGGEKQRRERWRWR